MKRRTFTAAGLLMLAGCSAESPTDGPAATGSSASGDWRSVSIDHAFGTTTIDSKPTRVVTLGWGSTEASLALGVVPVGMETQTYAAGEDGQLPWVTEKLQELGAEVHMIPATVEEPAYEEIAGLEPDLILAPYSGITEEQYSLLTEIAPTVAYPKEAWTTPWREVITMVGTALGLTGKSEQLVTDLNARLDEAAAAHPELTGLTVAAVWDVGGKFWVYKPADARVAFLLDLGLESAPAVEELDTGDKTYAYGLSYEQTDRLESDILVSYASTEKAAQTFLDQSYARAIPAVADGAVASIVGDQLIAAMSPPTALSLTWGLKEYVTLLTGAAEEVG